MNDNSTQIGSNFISLADASKQTGYHQDYLGFLARTGKLKAFKVGRNWVVLKNDLDDFIRTYKNGRTEVIDDTGTKIKVHVEDTSEPEAAVQNLPVLPEIEKPVEHYSRTNDLSSWRDTSALANSLSTKNLRNTESSLFSQPSNYPLQLSNLKSEVFEDLNSKVANISKSLDRLENKVQSEESKQTQNQTGGNAVFLPLPGPPQDLDTLPALQNKFNSNFQLHSEETAVAPAQENFFSTDKVSKLKESFKNRQRVSGAKTLAYATSIAALGFLASIGWNFLSGYQNSFGPETRVVYENKKTGKDEAPLPAPDSTAQRIPISGPQIVMREKFTTETVVKTLGPDTSLLKELIDQRLNQYLTEGKFKGEKGDKGEAGVAQTLQGGWTIGYVPASQPGGVGAGTIGSFTYFSSNDASISILRVGTSLNVSGSASLATTTVTGTLTATAFVGDGSGLTGISGGSGNSAFTLGSGLIYNATSTDLVGIGTITPTTTLFVQGKGGTNIFALASSTGSQLLTVTQAGNLGLGTTTPAQKFVVIGDARVTGAFFDSSNASGTIGMVLQTTGTSTQWVATSTLGISGSGTIDGSGANGFSARWTDADTLAQGKLIDNGTVLGVNATSSAISFNLQGSGTLDPFNVSSSSGISLLMVKESGMVSISTTTPNAALHIHQDASSTLNTTLYTVASTTPVLQLGQRPLTSPSANGTYIGVNAPLAFSSGDFINFQTNSSAAFVVNGAGSITRFSGVNGTQLTSSTFNMVNNSGTAVMGQAATGANSHLQLQAGLGAGSSITFYTTNSERMRLDGNGNLGINTTTPTAMLYVSNVATTTKNIFVLASSANTSLLTVNALGSTTLSSLGTGVVRAISGELNIGLVSLTSDVSGILPIANGGTATSSSPSVAGQLLTAHGSGSWGVANLIAGSNITITTSTLGQITLASTGGGSGNAAWTIGSGLIYNATSTDEVGIGTSTPDNTLTIQGNGSTNPFRIASSTGANLLVVTQAGNVGIGDDSPAALFTVGAGDAFRVNSSGQITSIGGTTGAFLHNNNLQLQNNGGNANVGNSGTAANSHLQLQSGSGQGSSIIFSFGGLRELMRLDGNGNLGIGTTTPIAALQVTGPGINQVPSNTTTTRAVLISPNPLASTTALTAIDYRALEVSSYQWTLASTTSLSQAYGSLFNAYTISTTSTTTLANAGNIVIAGAPIAGGTGGGVNVSSSTAFTIQGGAVATASGTVTNAYSLYVNPPTGATNNYAAVFTGGNVGIGSTAPSSLLTVASTSSMRSILPETTLTYDLGSSARRWNTLWAGTTNIGTSTWSITESQSNGRFSLFDQANGAGNERLTVLLTSGNVGIGTTTPTSQLHVQGAAGSSNAFTVSSSTGATLLSVTPAGNLTFTGTVSGGTFNPSFTTGSVVFQGASGLAQDNANFFWDDTNNRLGLASTSPTANFVVQGTGGQSADLVRIASSTNAVLFSVSSNGSTTITNLSSALPVRSTSGGSLFNGAIVLSSSDVSGILPIANGGTATSSSPSVAGQLLTAHASGSWGVANLVAGSNITITTTTLGQITLASTDQFQGTVTGTGTNGFSSRWTSSSALSTGKLIDDGTVLGVNASSSTISLNVQGSGTLDPFQVSSSSASSLLIVKESGRIGLNTTTPNALLHLHLDASSTANSTLYTASTTNGGILQLGQRPLTSPSANGTYIGVNTASTFSGNIVDFQFNTIRAFAIDSSGSITTFGGITNTRLDADELLLVSNGGTATIGNNSASANSHLNILGGANANSSILFSPSLLVERMRLDGSGNLGLGTTTPVAALTVVGPAINQSGASNLINRGVYIAPTSTIAAALTTTDFRALEVSAYTFTLASTTSLSQAYGSLFNAYTISTTSTTTLANAGNIVIAGAPIAGGTGGGVAISSSTAFTIQGGAVATASGTVTNAYSLYVNPPTGATNNYAAVFTGGNVGIGTTTPNVPLLVVGSTTITSLNSALPVRSTASGALFNGAIALGSSDVSGILPIANGGTATSSSPSVAGQLLTAHGSGSWGVANLVAGSNVTITTTTLGQITIAAAAGSGNAAFTIGSGLIYNATSTDEVGIGTSTPDNTLTIQGNGTTNPFRIASSTGANLLVVAQTGNVGIGDDSPAALFTVGANDAFRVNSSGQITSIGGTTNAFLNGNQLQLLNNGGNATVGNGGSSANSHLVLQGGNGAGSSIIFNKAGFVEAMRLDGNGNLGINTTTPRAFLVVQNVATTTKDILVLASSSGASFLKVDAAGNMGLGTTSPLVKLHIGSVAEGGSVRIAKGYLCVDDNDSCSAANSDGGIYSVIAAATGADLAENYPSLDLGLTAGDVIAIDLANPIHIIKATSTSKVLGIVSTKPGFLLSSSLSKDSANATTVPVALSGRVPVKVTNENGPILIGDYLTNSKEFPGFAMKANYSGLVIGQALESFDPGQTTSTAGQILALADIGYQVINNTFVLGENDGQLTGATSTLNHSSAPADSGTGLVNAFLIDQKGSGNILQLQKDGVDRLLVGNDGSLKILSSASGTYDLLTVSNASSTMFRITSVGDAYIRGKLTVGKDTAGTAKINAGDNQVRVSFASQYSTIPKVVATPQGLIGSAFGITEKSTEGFSILLSGPAENDIAFDWIALAQPEETSFQSSFNLEVVSAPAPSLPSEPSPSPGPVPEENPPISQPAELAEDGQEVIEQPPQETVDESSPVSIEPVVEAPVAVIEEPIAPAP